MFAYPKERLKMKKAYSSKLILSKDDFAVVYDYKYKFFLPSLILLVAIFTALSPLFKGMDFWPVFVVICVLAVIFIFITLNRTVFPLLRKRCNRNLIEKKTVRNRLCY